MASDGADEEIRRLRAELRLAQAEVRRLKGALDHVRAIVCPAECPVCHGGEDRRD